MTNVCPDCLKVIEKEFYHGPLHAHCLNSWFEENYAAGINCSQPAENETTNGGGEIRKDFQQITPSVSEPRQVT